ncbi:MAG: 50S ribosomal protein L28 [Candidatus Liptonbacteria bacterium]|nr:50S ribosomal protein L28 [Candidatus Liptonbacteria bacterium]
MRKCEICGKSSAMMGTRKLLRGHYNPTNRSRKYPNLQKTKLPNGKRILACTQCIKTLARKA